MDVGLGDGLGSLFLFGVGDDNCIIRNTDDTRLFSRWDNRVLDT